MTIQAMTIQEGSHVRIKATGKTGTVLYTPDENGPWYEIQLDNELPHTVEVVTSSDELEFVQS